MKFEEHDINTYFLDKDKSIKKLHTQNQVKTEIIEDQMQQLDNLLKDREQYFEKNVYQNIDGIIKPYIKLLKLTGLTKDQKKYLQQIEDTIDHIAQSVGNPLQVHFPEMTIKEMQIAEMIKNNLTSKEISNMLHLSDLTIFEYRKKIRKKLGLTNTSHNLRLFLEKLWQNGY